MYCRLAIFIFSILSAFSAQAYNERICHLWGSDPQRVPLWTALFNWDYETYRGHWYDVFAFMRDLKESPHSVATFPSTVHGFSYALAVLKALDLPLTINTQDPQDLRLGERLQQKLVSYQLSKLEEDTAFDEITVKLRNDQRALRGRTRTLHFSFPAESPLHMEVPKTWVALDAQLPVEIRYQWNEPALMYRFIKQIEDAQAVQFVNELQDKGHTRIDVRSEKVVSDHHNSAERALRWLVHIGLPIYVRQAKREIKGVFLSFDHTRPRRPFDPLRLRFRTEFKNPECDNVKAYYYEPPADLQSVRQWDHFWSLIEKCTSTIDLHFTKDPIYIEDRR